MTAREVVAATLDATAFNSDQPHHIADQIINRLLGEGYEVMPLVQPADMYCRHLAAQVFKPEGVDLWMRSPNPSLNNATPEQFCDAGDEDRVIGVLLGLIHGNFA